MRKGDSLIDLQEGKLGVAIKQLSTHLHTEGLDNLKAEGPRSWKTCHRKSNAVLPLNNSSLKAPWRSSGMKHI